MDRRLIAGLLGLLVVGCAQSRSGLPARYGQLDPVDAVDALPPINVDINQRSSTGDLAARRASLLPDTYKTPAAGPPGATGGLPTSPPSGITPALVGKPPVAPGTSTSSGPYDKVPAPDLDDRPPPAPDDPPAGRSVSTAGPDVGSPRAQAPPMNRPDDQPPEPRPAPFDDKTPSGPRPQSPANPPGGPSPTPTAPPIVEASTPPPGPPPLAENQKTVDPAVKTVSATSNSPPPSRLQPGEIPLKGESGGMVATVGKEIITMQQVQNALRERLGKVPPGVRVTAEDKQALSFEILGSLIQRSLILQAAKRRVTDPKALQVIYDANDKKWMEEELPPMLRAYKASNIHDLKNKLALEQRSLDQIRDDYRQQLLARDFVMSGIHTKLTASLPEKLDYYNAHRNEFDRPASVTWSEIEVTIAKSGGRDEARRRADAILARLRKGEEFARIARTESHGATAREGGRWETGLDGSAIPDINAALNAIPTGRISEIIEAPGGFHIVRVDAKREAGPAPYYEIQDKIKDLVLMEKYTKYSNDFVESLRAKTIVTTIFDPPPGDPKAIRTGGQQAGGR
jgi:hypothetical protein